MNISQTGRSMIEMLGVLAIVGVLSVAGIVGYSKAMTKYKLNKLAEEYALFFQELQPYIKELCLANVTGVQTDIGVYLNQWNVIPNNWSFTLRGDGVGMIRDSFGRRLAPFTRNKKYLAFDYYMQSSKNDMASKEDELLCQKIWIDILKPHADKLYRVYMSEGSYALRSYGTSYCNKESKPCISERTISEIIQTCSSCKEGTCVLAVDFTW